MSYYGKSTVNYSGRTVDLLLLQFVNAPTADATVRADISKYPRITAGIEKIVQRYALLFLTQLGTVKNVESEGTEFMSLLGAGRIYDETTLRSAAVTASKRVVVQMHKEDAMLATLDDEAIDEAEVIDLSMDRPSATVSVTVRITSKAGESYTYITPIETGV